MIRNGDDTDHYALPSCAQDNPVYNPWALVEFNLLQSGFHREILCMDDGPEKGH